MTRVARGPGRAGHTRAMPAPPPFDPLRAATARLAALGLAALGLAPLVLAACTHAPSPATDAQRLALAVRSRPVVLLGETHDNAAQHALRAEALRTLLAAGARPALLMEQFDREHQPAIDRALAGPNPTVDDVLAAGAPDPASVRSGWDWRFYRPYLALALAHRLPIVAANVSRADARRAVQGGLASIGFEPGVPADVQRVQTQAIVDGHCGAIGPGDAGPMVAAQVARDQFMARAIEANGARGVVLIAGNGHVRRDIGVPRWLGAAARARSVSIGLLEAGRDTDAAAYDVVIETPAQPRADPCADLRMPRAAPRG